MVTEKVIEASGRNQRRYIENLGLSSARLHVFRPATK
jgi:hypothetical protein